MPKEGKTQLPKRALQSSRATWAIENMRNQGTKHQFYYKYQETTMYLWASICLGSDWKEADLPFLCILNISLHCLGAGHSNPGSKPSYTRS